jgi:predicted MFS family arabinose efflux permease
VILGSPIGGLLIESFGWKAIFIFSGSGTLVGLLLVIKFLSPMGGKMEQQHSADWLGATFLFTFTTGLLLATTTSSVFPFGSTMNLLFWGIVLLALMLLIWNTQINPDPMISIDLLKNRQ